MVETVLDIISYIGLVSDIDSIKVTPPPNAIKSTNRNTPSMFKGIVFDIMQSFYL